MSGILLPRSDIPKARSLSSWEDVTRWAQGVDRGIAEIQQSLRSIAEPLNGILVGLGAGQRPTLASTKIVRGPASATENGLALFADVSGAILENGGVTLDDSGTRLRQADGEWIAMAGAGVKTSQTSQTASTSYQALFSETMQSGMLDVAGRNLHIRAWGRFTWDASPPATHEFILRYGNTNVWHYSAVIGGALSLAYRFDADVVTVSSGNVRCFGWLYPETVGVPSDIAVASTPTTSGAVTVSWGHLWAANDAGSSMTCELASIELGGLVA